MYFSLNQEIGSLNKTLDVSANDGSDPECRVQAKTKKPGLGGAAQTTMKEALA